MQEYFWETALEGSEKVHDHSWRADVFIYISEHSRPIAESVVHKDVSAVNHFDQYDGLTRLIAMICVPDRSRFIRLVDIWE